MKIFLINLLLLISATAFSQGMVFQEKKFAIHLSTGVTQGFSYFEQTKQPTTRGFRQTYLPHLNIGLGFKVFHKKNWFTSYSYNEFAQQRGIVIEGEGGNIDGTRYPSHKYRYSGNFNGNFTFHVGKTKMLSNQQWWHNWLAGLNLEFVVDRPNAGSLSVGTNNGYFGLFSVGDETKGGIAPSLQGGYQLTFRGKNMGISLITLGNFGLKFYKSNDYRASIEYQTYEGTLKTKGDFIAAILQYEVYFGNKK